MTRLWMTLLLLLALACGDSNPLIGSWVVDKDKTPRSIAAGLSFSGVSRLEFQEERMVSGPQSIAVTYDIDGDRVTVTTAEGQGTVYTVNSSDSISLETPMGDIVFRRDD